MYGDEMFSSTSRCDIANSGGGEEFHKPRTLQLIGRSVIKGPMPSLFPKPTSMLKLPIILEGTGNKLSIIASHVGEYLGIPLL